MELVHQQTLLKVYTKKFFKDEESMNDFLRRLVKHLKMDIIIEPRSAFCDQPGNTGLTGQIGLVTSHATIHSWDEFDYHQMDIYSCKSYDLGELLEFIKEALDPFKVDYLNFDRETYPMNSIDYN